MGFLDQDQECQEQLQLGELGNQVLEPHRDMINLLRATHFIIGYMQKGY